MRLDAARLGMVGLIVAGLLLLWSPSRVATAADPGPVVVSTADQHFLPLTSPHPFEVRALADDLRERAVNVVEADPSLHAMLKGHAYSVKTVAPWYSDGALVGAAITLRLDAFADLTGRWMLHSTDAAASTRQSDSSTFKVRRVREILASVLFDRDAVVETEPLNVEAQAMLPFNYGSG